MGEPAVGEVMGGDVLGRTTREARFGRSLTLPAPVEASKDEDDDDHEHDQEKSAACRYCRDEHEDEWLERFGREKGLRHRARDAM